MRLIDGICTFLGKKWFRYPSGAFKFSLFISHTTFHFCSLGKRALLHFFLLKACYGIHCYEYGIRKVLGVPPIFFAFSFLALFVTHKYPRFLDCLSGLQGSIRSKGQEVCELITLKVVPFFLDCIYQKNLPSKRHCGWGDIDFDFWVCRLSDTNQIGHCNAECCSCMLFYLTQNRQNVVIWKYFSANADRSYCSLWSYFWLYNFLVVRCSR